jgi:ketosteroid isomerase-like protein
MLARDTRTVPADHVEFTRFTMAAWNRGDVDAILSRLAPDAEWAIAEENPNARLLRGHEEIADYLHDWLSTIDGLRYELSELVNAGDAVVALGTMSGRAGEDGPKVTVPLAFVTFFERDVCVRVEEYLDHGRALEAAGASRSN